MGGGRWGVRGFEKELGQTNDVVITWRIYESIHVQVHCIALDQSYISWQSREPRDHPGLDRIAENKLTAALKM